MQKVIRHPDGSRTVHRYGPMPPDRRPQDPTLDGRTLKYEPLEHGGEFPDCMPLAIRVIDAQGRSAIYVPIEEDGQVVDSEGFALERGPD
jgi:hypothetical protein